jgi:hypothetical protein
MRTDAWHDSIIDLQHPLACGDRAALSQLAENVRGFVGALRNEKGGTLHTDAEQAISAALAAVVGEKTDMDGRMAAYRRLLGVTHRRLQAAVKQRSETIGSAAGGAQARFVQRRRAQYGNRWAAVVVAVRRLKAYRCKVEGLRRKSVTVYRQRCKGVKA